MAGMTAAPKKRRDRPEARIQMAIVKMLEVALWPGAIVHASLNEEATDLGRMINAAMGAFSGFADLVVMVGRQVLFLEVKTARGRQSEDQLEFQRLVEAMGWPYEIVRSVDDAMDALLRHNVPTRIVSCAGTSWARVRLVPETRKGAIPRTAGKARQTRKGAGWA